MRTRKSNNIRSYNCQIRIYGIATISPDNEAQLQYGARKVRVGQEIFRENLLKLYDCKCCNTGTAVINVLDAAHIIPFSEKGITEESNGLLLRADIHNLFHDGLISINPKTMKITVDDLLMQTEYWKYNETLLMPRTNGSHPSSVSLEWKMNDNRNSKKNSN